MNEIWIELTLNPNNHMETAIVAISNRGNMRRRNGIIEPIPLRQMIKRDNKQVIVSRILAEYFIPKSEDDIAMGRNIVDHITHYPNNMNINDVRNLRWCTQKENCNFEEAINNMTGRKSWNKGKKMSDESRLKMSEAWKSREPITEETRLKMSESHKGKILTEETRHKISESHKLLHRNKSLIIESEVT